MNERRMLILLLAVFSALLFVELPGTQLFEPDEARYAEIPREMLVSGDFVTPRQNGSIYIEKPPLVYWLNAGSMKIFGENSYAARLPTRLAGLGILLLLIIYGGTSAPYIGLWAGVLYLSTPLPFALSRINLTDGLLSFGLCLALLALLKLLEAKEEKRDSLLYQVGFGLGLGIAFLSKGLIAFVFPGAVILIWCAVSGSLSPLFQTLFSWATPISLLISIPWLVAIQRVNPEFMTFFFVHEHFQRFSTDVHKRVEPFYFFIVTFLWGFFPWSLLVWKPLRNFVFRSRDRLMKNRNEFIIGTWFLIILLFFSASHSKLIPYILPAMPAAALLMATHIIQNPSHRWKKRLVVSAGVLAALYTSLIIVLPNLSNRYSAKKLIDVIHEEKIENVVSYHSYPESATWLLKRTIPVVSFRGELASVGPLDSHLFWTEETFWQKWNNREPMAVFVRVNDDAPFHDSKNTPARLLGENKRYRLFSNVSSQNEKM